ncbi:MAG: SDR family NAD(P)-dependent oxidoreductase, partial [Hymenobacter sp.]
MNYALITGGSRGIGRAVAVQLASQGYNILLNYKSNHAEAEITKAAVELAGVRCELLPFDVASREATDAALGGWLETNKDARIEVLVNNAGIRQDNLFIWLTEEQWSGVISTSLDAFFYVTKHVLNQMLAARFGRIIT